VCVCVNVCVCVCVCVAIAEAIGKEEDEAVGSKQKNKEINNEYMNKSRINT
jgi:hypothetical protein